MTVALTVLAAVALFAGFGFFGITKPAVHVAVAAAEQPAALPYIILEREHQKKGGSLNPPRPPKYVLLVVKGALTEARSDLTTPRVEATLRDLLRTARVTAERSGEQVDGVSAFLYRSADHLRGGNAPLGTADWWPKGDGFDPKNAANIENKATHVERVSVAPLQPPARTAAPAAKLGQRRLSEERRRAIYAELVLGEDKATREANAAYPTDARRIPRDRLRETLTANMEEGKRLRKKYERELLLKHKISEAELAAVKAEARENNWPLPPSR